MLPTDLTLAFFGLALLLGFAPGPDNLVVLMVSATQGVRAAFAFIAGLCTGLLGHITAVALGVAAVVAASPAAFTALKLLGAAYLLYLAWGAWFAPVDAPGQAAGDASGAATPPRTSGLGLWRRGLVMNLSNPKVLLFFLALLPQFTRPQLGPVAWQAVWLGAWFMLATLISFGSIAVLAGSLGRLLRRSARAQQGLNRASALLFVALALSLALASR